MDLMQQDQSSAPLRRVQPARRRWPWPLDLYQSAVGKKWAMAVTGVMLLGFVFVHMVGNLKVYLGPAQINHYGEWLRDIAVPALPRTVFLWLLRTGLIAAFAVHMHAAWALTRMNHRARPAKYVSERDYVAANFASRTMRWTGIIVILFLFFHLADLTWGSLNPHFVRGNVYHNMAYSFSRVPVAAIYIVANLALAVHIFHGAWSLFASLGVSNPKLVAFRRRFAIGFAAIILLGNISFPIAVQAHVIEDHGS
ncbi:MAG: succinate dehydrogenase / fumarate reductase, cytochrome b subunit, partial [Actinomycetota bacterium]|nr:succinate dehydrogenase / fumarate reductase, cytochrome b subunit [Actinomycetota bacterium]